MPTRHTRLTGPARLTGHTRPGHHNPGRVLSRAQIQERVWNHRADGSGIVDTYVYYLRRKLGDAGVPLIRTVRGAGYLLCSD
ncbi:winged helix-turn-helix domain-containing protein [Streptomyces mirabilis]|uniref:winged helix-turn-helix domain-containing protein n=1 Tax=Streptomyces mirabilis TaxID=68239 RepID=UPI00365EE829